MAMRLQEWIHKIEVGSGYRILSYIVGIIAFVALAVFYDLALYRNLSTMEAMDAAQLARNIANGKGYTTQFIRPLSLYVLDKHQRKISEARVSTSGTNASAAGFLEGNHPDLANPPAYPMLLAGLLKFLRNNSPDVTRQKKFQVYLPDLWITILNQGLFLLMVILVFWLGRSLFDPAVGWLSASLVGATELFWRFTNSGLSTVLLMLLFFCLFWALSRLELVPIDPAQPPERKVLLWAALAGIFLGLGALTRYSFGVLAIPVLFLIGSGPGKNRVVAAALCALTFAAVFLPWLIRNYAVSATAFGTAGFDLFQGSAQSPGHELERTLRPEFGLLGSADFWRKLLNVRPVLQYNIPAIGGSWVGVLFLAGLLVPFRRLALGRLRWFVVSSLLMLMFAQALAGTGSPESAAELNPENLVVVAAPVAFLYGVALLFNLLEQFTVPVVRQTIAGVFLVLASLPLLLAFIAPHPSRLVYPPYYPPWLQDKAAYLLPDQWMASDIPWAIAWYGNRQAVWLPPRQGNVTNAVEGFYGLHARKPLSALHLTSMTLKSLDAESVLKWRRTEADDKDWEEYQKLIKRMGEAMLQANLSDTNIDTLKTAYQLAQKHWLQGGGGDDWASFALGIYVKQEVPAGFPLRKAPEGVGDEIFLTDSERSDKK